MRISDWSSDVCSSDLLACRREEVLHQQLLLLSLRHPHQRIAAFLIMMLARQVGEHNLVNGSRIALPMARRDIADPLVLAPATLRSDERRVGKEVVSTGRFRRSQSYQKKKKKQE